MVVLGSTARSLRWFIANQSSANNGWFNISWNGVINDYSVVHISASEAHLIPDLNDPHPGSGMHAIHRFKRNNPPYVKVQVKNVCPHSDAGGGVNFWLEIDSTEIIDIAIDITVFDDPENYAITGVQ